MKARFKFEIMNNLGTILQDEEFKVAYYILNRLALEDTNRVKIYRAMLADLTGKSERTISRITDKLDEKGIIKKDTVSDSKNRYNYYSIHPNIEQSITQNYDKLGHEEQETTPNLVTDDRFNKKEKKYKNKRNIKEKEFEESELEQAESSTVEDEDCDWKTELIRLESRIKRASSIDELKALSLQFNIMQNKSGIPTELEELLERVQNTAKAKVWSIKAKKCYS